MNLRIVLLFLFITCVVNINARRYSGSSRSKPSSSGGRHTPIFHPPSTRPASTGGWSQPRQKNTESTSATRQKNTESTSVTRQKNKDVNTGFIEAEGGRAKHPENHGRLGTTTENKQKNPYAPSAPPAPNFPPPYPIQGQPGRKPDLGPQDPLPIGFKPPIPPYPSNSHPLGTSDPYYKKQLPNSPNNSHKPPVSHHNSSSPFPNHGQTSIYHRNSSAPTLNSPHFPPSAPHFTPSAPQFPPSAPHYNPSAPHFNPSAPHYNPSAPHLGQSSPAYADHPYYRQHPGQNHGYPYQQNPYPMGNPHQSFSSPSGYPIGNPYQTHVPNNHYQPGQPMYQPPPQYLAQPASQPYMPGQTVLVVPNQQSSGGGGRGIGSMITEALIFSTVNAGVNRLINPHHHQSYNSGTPGGSSTSTTTHLTVNNQYYMYPNGTTALIPPGSTAPAGTYPVENPNNAGTYPIGSPNTSGTYRPETNPSPNLSTRNQGSYPVIPNTNQPRSNPGTQPGNSTPPNQTNNNPQVDYTPQYFISDEELYNITEELFAKENFDVNRYVTLNLQGQAKPLDLNASTLNLTDEAPRPLLFVQSEAYDIPSIRTIRKLYDNYEHNADVKEILNDEKRKEIQLFLDVLLNTNTVTKTMNWLSKHQYIEFDDFERKETLRRIWFNTFLGSTSGFERVFMSEKYGSDLVGITNWIYFDYQESFKKIDYLGYYDKKDLGNKASLLKLNVKMDEIVRPNVTMFVGTLPELEISLYTICFYTRPNNVCPVSLGGTKFYLYTHSFRYYGNDLIDLAMPIF